MTITKIFSINMALALLLVVSLTGLSAAEARSWHRDAPDVTCTPEQAAEIRAMRDEHYKQVEPLQRQLRVKQAELEALYYGDNKDSAKVQEIFRDMADIKAKLFMLGSEYHAKCDAKGYGHGSWGGGPRHHRGGWEGSPAGEGPRHYRGGW